MPDPRRSRMAAVQAQAPSWTATRQPALPIRAERLVGVADLATLDLFDQPASCVARRPFAGEAALRRLDPVGASVDEPPAHAVRRRVGIDAPIAPVLGGVRAAGGGGDLGDRLIEGASRVLGGEAPGSLSAVRVSPTDLPTATMPPDAHAYPRSVVTYSQAVVRRWVHMWVFVT
jgi:hypothetical protein